MPVVVDTAFSGTINVVEQDIFTFPRGIIGYEGAAEYCFLPQDRVKGLYVLQMCPAGVAFAVLDYRALTCTRTVQLELDDLVDLDVRRGDQLQTYVVITQAGYSTGVATANLSAPLVVNLRSRLGKQVVQWETPWKIRFALAGQTREIPESEPAQVARVAVALS